MTQEELKGIFAKNLTKRVKSSGRTQRSICNEIGVVDAALAEWMSAKKFPLCPFLAQLCTVLDCRPADLFSEADGDE